MNKNGIVIWLCVISFVVLVATSMLIGTIGRVDRIERDLNTLGTSIQNP